MPVEQTIDREKVLDLWSSGAPANDVAAQCECHPSSVRRIAAQAFEMGDERGAPQSHEARDLYRAQSHMKKIAELSRKGMEVSMISNAIGLPDHVVRAAIYLATQAGLKTGFVLGA